MNYQKITDQLFNTLDSLKKYSAKESDSLVQAIMQDHTNKFYYLLGHLPVEEQDAFMGLALATGYVHPQGIETWKQFRKCLTDAKVSPGMIMDSTSSYDMTAERAYVGSRVQRALEQKHNKGECPPDDLVPPKPDGCAMDDDCEECWRDAMMKLLEVNDDTGD